MSNAGGHTAPGTGNDAVDVLVYGAGAIGQYIGGRLATGALRVHFIARAPLVEVVRGAGMQVTELHGEEHAVPRAQISASETLDDAPTPRLTLLTVKGGATADAAADLAQHLPEGAPVISFQNGVDNVGRIRTHAPALQVIAGMVPYNVILDSPGMPRRSSDGRLGVQRNETTESWRPAFERAGLPLDLHPDMTEVQWGKLLLNLNNPVNALSGEPLLTQLLDRGYRRVLATMQREALTVLKAAGITPARATPLPPNWTPRILSLPTPLYRAIASRMLHIDPQARSSMQDDRRAGRTTEIDDLCGAVVRLAGEHGVPAPVNARIAELVRTAATGCYYTSAQLQAAVAGTG